MILIFYYISFRLATLLNITDAPIQVPNIFYFTVSFNFLNSSSQTCLYFAPEMSAILTFNTVQIIYTDLAWILYSLHLACFFWSKKS